MFESFVARNGTIRRRKPSVLGTLGLVAGALLLSLLMGYFGAIFPASFVAKILILMLLSVVVLWALFGSWSPDTPDRGGFTRASINVWVFLMGACPAYLPFKFGPLPGLNPLRVAFAVALFAALYGLIISTHIRERLLSVVRASKAVFFLFSGLVAWQFLCAILGEQPIFSIYFFLKVIFPAFAIYIIAMAYVRDWQDMERMATFLVAGVMVTCIVGVIEWRTQSNVFLQFFPTDSDELRDLGWVIQDKMRGGSYRVSATFGHPLSLAEYLCMVLPFVAMLAFSSVSRWMRIVAWIVLPVLLGLIYLAQTRSSLVAASASLVVMGLILGLRLGRDRKNPHRAMLGWALVVTLVSAAVALSGALLYLAEGRTEAEAGSSRARVVMLDRAMQLLEEQPIQGYGPGLGAVKIGRIQPGQRSPTIDSYFMSVAIEGGFVALGLFVLGMATLLWQAVRAAILTRGVASWTMIALSVAIFASLIIKLVLSLPDSLELLYFFAGVIAVGMQLSNYSAKDLGALSILGSDKESANRLIAHRYRQRIV